jgi:FKBP-type peptidyl-prolyl cis-trans isomerase 2
MTVNSELIDGDVIRVTYTARVADTGRIIDTTDTEAASEADMVDVVGRGPAPIVLGEGHLFEPVEDEIKDSTVGETIRVTVDPNNAFGQIDPTDYTNIDIDLIPEGKREHGARLSHKGRTGFVESLNGDEAKLNFNHPLAGQAIEYELTVQERIEDRLERVRAVLTLYGLGDEVDISLGAPDSGDLRIAVPDPREEAWKTEKSRVIEDLRDFLPVESITVIERHGDAR